ncbi:MAG: O-antigen ligase family protein [Planctomycetota bacterium]|nr:O-antigen ligase family protein [Planctomycetota bacterium]
MSTVATTIHARPIPRADAPRETYVRRGFFPFAESHLTGLPPLFWCLQLYIFLSVSALDEHFETTIQSVLPGALNSLGPRMLIGSLTLVMAVGQMVTRRRAMPAAVGKAPTVWLVGFVIASFFSTIWAYLPGFAIDAFIGHFTSMLSFALILVIVQTRRELVLTILTFCAGIGVYMLLSWWEWRGGRYDYAQGVMRMVGAGSAYADPNSFAATIVFAVPLMTWVFVSTSKAWVRICAILFMLLTALAVLKTSSRSGLVLFCMACTWALVFLPRGRMKSAALVVAVIGAMTLPAMLSESQIERIQTIFSGQTYAKEESTHGRVEGYVVAWKMFEQRPLLGVGPGNWSPYRQAKMDGNPLMPHNLTGQLLATRGAVGSLTFLAFLFATLGMAWSTYRSRKQAGGAWNVAVSKLACAVLMTYALLFISGLGAHNLTRPNWYWCSALLLVALGCRSDEDADTHLEETPS